MFSSLSTEGDRSLPVSKGWKVTAYQKFYTLSPKNKNNTVFARGKSRTQDPFVRNQEVSNRVFSRATVIH